MRSWTMSVRPHRRRRDGTGDNRRPVDIDDIDDTDDTDIDDDDGHRIAATVIETARDATE